MKRWMFLLVAGVFGLWLAGTAISATLEEECISKCKSAVKMIKEKGLNAGIAEINKKNGKFVSNVTFVILFDFKGVVRAHPIKPEMIGKNRLADKDSKGKIYYKEYIEVAKTKGRGWVDHMWKSPDKKDFPKRTYIMRIEGQDLAVAAGYVIK